MYTCTRCLGYSRHKDHTTDTVFPGDNVIMLNSMGKSGPQICIHPEGHLLMDEELEVKITGLDQLQKITVHAVIREGGSVFESSGCFTSDARGEVNMATQPSVAGSYTGVSPMGIFWSMVQAPGQKEGLRLMKKDTDTPMTTNLTVFYGHISTDTIHDTHLKPVCTGSLDRWYKAPGVRKEVVRHGRIRGVFYLPPGDGPFPGVIDMFGTVGGIFEFRSALLASRGFASLSLPYFAFDDLPETLEQVDFDYFMEATDWIVRHKAVFHDGIGVIGVSRGGDIALLLAAHSPKISCVVDISGCTFNQTYGMKYKDGFIPAVPAPDKHGLDKLNFPSRFLRNYKRIQLDNMYQEDGAFVCNECWPHTKDDLIPVWNYDAKILAIVGEDDKLNPWKCNQLLKDNMPPEKADNFKIVSYKGAGHLIEPPYTPLCRMSYHKSYGTKFCWGGYPETHAVAQEDSWRRILEHFHKYIPCTSNSDFRSKL